ncbi:hypothetical protein COCMIDRAFT_40560 [Bipolaris oryzae ATCC 44560]|uniref:Uncharacterized protein n=1 Tax=Bipolaris oryzae ATCC 44560 TaxID=930090 RepID=W6YPE2_COCMI|nr:uncharacterized protein COCMIDRAFT_40560 [Bipolaris oryzae ATCC 44560]EUC41232.1 hypothetical protein COCMIDRAFT_40560 [Bipolaris oryzae ATCC 44560]
MAPAAKQNTKPVVKTASPFTETQWPELSHDDELVVLEMLSNLIAPLGDYRRTHMHPSKGKKRKRATTKPDQDDSTTETPPPPPPIGNHLLIGLNSVTRHLEALAAKTAPSTTLVASAQQHVPGDNLRPLSMVILTHPKPSLSPAHAHLPTLVHLSTLSPPSATPDAPLTATRLVPLPTLAESRLASSLHIPRVGALAIYADAPGARVLEDYVREHIGVTECKWVPEALSAEWRGMKVSQEVPRAK